MRRRRRRSGIPDREYRTRGPESRDGYLGQRSTDDRRPGRYSDVLARYYRRIGHRPGDRPAGPAGVSVCFTFGENAPLVPNCVS